MNNEWQLIKIGDVGRIVTGKTPPTHEKRYYGKGFPFVTPTDIPYFGMKYIDSTERFLTSDWAIKNNNYLLPKDSICVVCIGSTIGKTCITTTDTFTNQQINSIIVNNVDFDSSFVFYALLKVIDKLKSIGSSSGAGKGIVNKSIFSELRLEFPNRILQSKIASIISSYDDLIIDNRRRIELNESLGKLLYEKWFFKYSLDNYIDSSSKMVEVKDRSIPSGWNILPIKDAIDINPSIEYKNGSSIRHLGMSGVSETVSVIDLKQLEIKNKSTGVKFQNNDVLLARITPCLQNGKTAFVQFLNQDEVATGSTEFIVLRQKILPSSYIYYLVRDQRFREAAQYAMVGASGRQRIHASFFDKYRVIVPPQQILNAFDNKVSRLLKYSAKLNEQNSVLIEMRDLLLELLINQKRLIR